ncbi:septum formation protein Maf [bacterium]|nr:septum formation protein Maf [bacterium]
MKKIYLASKSPRRIRLLKQIGIPFETIEKEEVQEYNSEVGDPVEYVILNAKKKAESVLNTDGIEWVLACDTIVYYKGEILEKPENKNDAMRKLRMLSNEWHEVYTGLYLCNYMTGDHYDGFEVTRVKFSELSDYEIELYVESGEPMDKAGAYGIQELGAMLVERVDGCFYNVVGLPIGRLMLLLEKASINRVDIIKNFKNF